jgi:ribonuclease D
MRRGTVGALLLLLFLSAARALEDPKDKPKADKPATPSEQYDALVKEFQANLQKLNKEFREAKTPEDQNKVRDVYFADVNKFARRFLEVARKNPKDPAALKALMWVAQTGQHSPSFKEALDLLGRDHPDSKEIKPICMMLAFNEDPAAEKFLRAVIAKNSDHDTKAFATLGLAQAVAAKSGKALVKKSPDATKLAKEAEKLYGEVVKNYGDVKLGPRTLGKVAEDTLDEFKNSSLSVGKKAPEIEGEDLDGKKFKLSDYKGKVVLLDFWGNW